jgi:NAD(P)-dependent dehydrogenase (short-subunit alcohol dehydrogenase family)
MSFDLGLKDARVLITGGTKGVGAAVVAAMQKAGARVVTTARSILATSSHGVQYVAADIATAEGCATVATSTIDRLGGPDILINVVGGSSAPAGGFASLDDDQWSKELNQNLK